MTDRAAAAGAAFLRLAAGTLPVLIPAATGPAVTVPAVTGPTVLCESPL
ncbi:hypothetical protein AB0C18_35825 [Nonomuraea muscovyensis]